MKLNDFTQINTVEDASTSLEESLLNIVSLGGVHGMPDANDAVELIKYLIDSAVSEAKRQIQKELAEKEIYIDIY
ncbi:hypothetical protein Ab1vBOLIVR5_gp206c [Agrobacterium phage OLIVR5]|uniref:Uncharacterized protein n=2 Tax=Caudoviricetes TaxID=2731619 RepID=A0A858MSV5_9CAUD|nr:hypothetical protein KNU99_gp195 [Agrobacterium phage OLIVR5]QIW87854.1 hypothetical protein Ab1vBOLIVR5_gp206c [Agrobacterium phage OLIVR5]QIW88119.1 hypothetical protein Ab1vBOLIVR6_gp212c [Agrobacterium phage OLIVR6]